MVLWLQRAMSGPRLTAPVAAGAMSQTLSVNTRQPEIMFAWRRRLPGWVKINLTVVSVSWVIVVVGSSRVQVTFALQPGFRLAVRTRLSWALQAVSRPV